MRRAEFESYIFDLRSQNLDLENSSVLCSADGLGVGSDCWLGPCYPSSAKLCGWNRKFWRRMRRAEEQVGSYIHCNEVLLKVTIFVVSFFEVFVVSTFVKLHFLDLVFFDKTWTWRIHQCCVQPMDLVWADCWLGPCYPSPADLVWADCWLGACYPSPADLVWADCRLGPCKPSPA